MIEKIIRDHLDALLSVPVLMEAPTELVAQYVILEKTGSGGSRHLRTATIALKSHAETLFEAAQLNEAVKDAMETLIELDVITKVELNSDYNFTDQAKKQYRYQAVYDIYHY